MFKGLQLKTQGVKPPHIGQLSEVSPLLFIVIGHAMVYCHKHNLPFVVTNILEKFGVSTTHLDGRAIDVSVREWTKEHIEGFIVHMNKINFLGGFY